MRLLEAEIEIAREGCQEANYLFDILAVGRVLHSRERCRILVPASLPLAPVRPNRPGILLGSLLPGFLLGAGLAFIREGVESRLAGRRA